MSFKSVLSVVSGFLAHHANDLDNAVTALSGVVDALPVNAETRAHIVGAISGLSASADNIRTALEAGLNAATDAAPVPVEIRASDVAAAVDEYVASHSSLIESAVTAYLVAHPPVAAPAPAPVGDKA